MKNLTEIFLESAPVRTRLSFGVNTPVILSAVSNDERRGKDNLKIDRHCYMRFSRLDEENKIVAQTEFSYWGFSKKEYAPLNFVHQYTQLMEIIKYVVPEAKFLEAKGEFQSVLKNKEDFTLFVKVNKLAKTNKSPDGVTHEGMKSLQKKISDSFVVAISPYVGEEGNRVNLLVVTGPNGKFLDLPREDQGFINSAHSKPPRIDNKYQRWYDARNDEEKASSDPVGASLDMEVDNLDLGGEDLDLPEDNLSDI